MKRLVLSLVFLLAFTLTAFADSPSDLPTLKTKTKTVAVFKNGLGFVYRFGETQLKDGWARMDAIPQAALGTLWVGSNSSLNPIEQVISFKEDLKADIDALTYTELLMANVGKTFHFTISRYGTEKSYEVDAKILAIPEDKTDELLALNGSYADMFKVQSVYYNEDSGRI